MRIAGLCLSTLLIAPMASAGELVELPQLLEPAQATFPARALEDRVFGVVELMLDIDVAGSVEKVEIVRCSTAAESGESISGINYGFAAAATTAASRLVFSPAMEEDGTKVPVRIGYTYTFRLPPLTAVKVAKKVEQRAQIPTAQLMGVLREKGTRRRIAGALITVFTDDGEGFEATTDREGTFRFFDLSVGKWKVLIDADGYLPIESSEELHANEELEVAYYQDRTHENPYDVFVSAEPARREVTRRSLSTAEIVKVPGTLGDPLLAIENLPGVAVTSWGDAAVRGSAPEETGEYIQGIDILFNQHVGGFRSVIAPALVKGVDFYPGNFSVRYGRHTGGILDVQLKRLSPDQVHGSLEVSALDSSFYLEAPISDTMAFAIAGRRSYIDFILDAAIPDDSDINLTAAPRYYDYQAIFDWRPTREHDLRLFLFGSDDELEILFRNVGDIDTQANSNTVGNHLAFQRVGAEYRFVPSTQFRNDLRVCFGRDDVMEDAFGRLYLWAEFLNLAVRDELTVRPGKNLTFVGGVDLRQSWIDYSVDAPRPPREGSPDLSPTAAVYHTEGDNVGFFDGGIFFEAEIALTERLTLIPGVRTDYFSSVKKLGFDPRFVARAQVMDSLTLKAGVGLVHQAPEMVEIDEAFGNPDLGLKRAKHFSIGAEWQPLDFLSADLALFYKDLDNLVSTTNALHERNGESVPMVFDNNGEGHVYGLEVYLEHDLAHNLRGWLSYTLSRSVRTDSGEADSRLFDYDQTHMLALVLSYRLPDNWEVGMRWRFVSGRPYTPYLGGVFRENLDVFEPVPGSANSARLPAFHQLDLRVDKRWVFDQWSLAVYLSVSNAYNRRNVESINYNYDYTETESVKGLPILPILGIRGDF